MYSQSHPLYFNPKHSCFCISKFFLELFLYIFPKYFHLTCSNLSFLEHMKYSNCFNALLYSFYHFLPFLDLIIFVDFSPYHGLCFPASLHAWWFLSYARHSEFYLMYCWVFCTPIVKIFFCDSVKLLGKSLILFEACF